MPDVHAVVVGAGFAGLYMLHRLRQLGLSARVFEAGDGVGGTWYWNRYPGARCDVESMDYSYSFSDELQQEWKWSERYASQPEILTYINHVADRFDLRRDIQLSTRVTAATFDEAARQWTVTTDRGDRVSARFCIMATGCLSSAQVPEVPRARELSRQDVSHRPLAARGRRLHRPARRRHRHRLLGHPVDPDHRRAGRAPDRLPAHAELQRPRAQRAARPGVRAAGQGRTTPTFRRQARESRVGFVVERSEASALAVTAEERRREYEKRWRRGGLGFTATYADLLTNEDANDTAAEFCREKIRAIVHDPQVAELLAPKDYPFGTKRLCVDTDYYETYNRDNVTLVDIRRAPIEAITPDGLRTTEAAYELDSIVFATGFDAMTGALLSIDIRGRGGRTLREAWAAGPAHLPRALRRRASRTCSRSPARAARRCSAT